jgi:hypothetical protein
MSTEIRLAVLTMVASFAATFALLWVHREPTLVFLVPPPVNQEPPAVQRPPRADPPAQPPTPSGPQAKKVPTKQPPAETAPPANLDGPPLPLLVALSIRPADPRGPDPAGPAPDGSQDQASQNQVDISNSSDQLLALTVIDVNASSQKTSSTQVLLPPNGQAHLGAEARLAMQSGDEVTVRSAGFRDLTRTVP